MSPEPDLELLDHERAWLRGEGGPARRFAVELLVKAAEIAGADEFVAIDFAHINSCHWSGRLSVDFAEFLLADDITFAVPTHTNASLIACDTPWLRPADATPVAVGGAERLMEIYEQLGCSTMWTCAPYLEPQGRPGLGRHVVGSESNAVSFFNSALGARTNKYGDLLDVCGAIVGRVPLAGLHTDAGRQATHHVRVELGEADLADPNLPHVLGVIVGTSVGARVPVITGVPTCSEDALKAIAAAAATAGAVEMFHLAGSTPEAETFDDAAHDVPCTHETIVGDRRYDDARAALSTRPSGPIDAVCLGAPHFSIGEFAELLEALGERRVAATVRFLVTTSRAVHHELGLRGWDDRLRDAGVDVVLDTCTYYPPRATGVDGVVMTNSAKWAYYAPGMLDVDVAFGSVEACVDAAVHGAIER